MPPDSWRRRPPHSCSHCGSGFPRIHSPGVRVVESGGIACLAHLHDLSEFVIQVHGGVGLSQIAGVILVELGRLVRNLAHKAPLAGNKYSESCLSNIPSSIGHFRPQFTACSSVADTVFRVHSQLKAISIFLNHRLWSLRLSLQLVIQVTSLQIFTLESGTYLHFTAMLNASG